MKPSLIETAIDAAMRADIPVMLHGRAGIGKTDLFRQVAQRHKIDFRHYRVLTKDPTDVQGVPAVDRGGKPYLRPDGTMSSARTSWAVPDNLPTEGQGVFLIDEINAAAPAMQAALYGIVLEGETEGWKKPPGWWIGCAGNLDDDHAIVEEMPTPLKTRLMHLELTPDLDDWCQWAVRSRADGRDNCRTELVAFMRFRPGRLHEFNPDTRTFPCPRTWEMVSKLLDASMPPEVELDMVGGTVGQGAAAELIGFLQVFRQLPSIDGIIIDPKGSIVPEGPSALYAVAGALARRSTDVNFDAVIEYAERLPREFNVLTISGAIRRDKALQNVGAYTRWAVKNSDMIS